MVTCKRSLGAVLLLGAVSLAGCGGSPSNLGGAGAGGRGGTSGAGGAGARDAGPEGGPTDQRADSTADARADGGDGAAPSDARSESASDLRGDVALDAPADGNADRAAPADGGADSPAPVGDGGAPGDALTLEAYLAVLTGAEQVPPIDTAASGSATLSYDPATRVLSWTLTHTVASATDVHIHTAGAGDNGAATFTLGVDASTTSSVTLDAVQEADLRLGHLYLDVHSSVAPAGEIRGQILRPGETLWIARLTGADEVPANHSTGTGAMSLIVNAAHTSAHYRLVTSLTPSGGHIPAGVAGVGIAGIPIVTSLSFVGSTSEADLSIDADTFSALDQTRLFANVHTALFGDGEIRGQLLRAGSRLYVSRMTGANEVPPVTSSGTGNASVAVDYRSTLVRYAATTSLSPTAAHIHPGIAGVAAAPILTFADALANTGTGASFAGNGTLSQAQIDALAAGRLYINVHTTAFPNGEIRGQLLRPGEQIFAAALSGSNEVPPVASAATGTTQLILNAAATLLRYESAVSGLGDATSAFLVNGPAGAAGGSSVATLTVVGTNPIGTLAVTATDVTNLKTSSYYLDIHSSLHPEGEIRGQVTPR